MQENSHIGSIKSVQINGNYLFTECGTLISTTKALNAAYFQFKLLCNAEIM